MLNFSKHTLNDITQQFIESIALFFMQIDSVNKKQN